MGNVSWRKASLSAAALLAASGAAMAQSFTSNFEAPTYAGSAAGTITTGQNAWYIPPVGGVDHNVFTYAGNAPGFVANPTGGAQFDSGHGQTGLPARAQHDVDFSSGGIWQAEFDCNGLYAGVLPAVDNLGSFSMQDSTIPARYFQQLMTWGTTAVNPYPGGPAVMDWTATADHFHMAIGYFTAALPTSITFELASAAWQDLPVNHWYHVTLKWNFDTAQILECSIKDITAGTPVHTDDLSARGFYLAGGPGSTQPLPTAIRLFAGGLDDVTGWDNVSISKVQTSGCYANCDHSTQPPVLNVNDFICFQAAFAAGDSYANCDGSTQPPVLNVNDFICFQAAFAGGCTAP